MERLHSRPYRVHSSVHGWFARLAGPADLDDGGCSHDVHRQFPAIRQQPQVQQVLCVQCLCLQRRRQLRGCRIGHGGGPVRTHGPHSNDPWAYRCGPAVDDNRSLRYRNIGGVFHGQQHMERADHRRGRHQQGKWHWAVREYAVLLPGALHRRQQRLRLRRLRCRQDLPHKHDERL